VEGTSCTIQPERLKAIDDEHKCAAPFIQVSLLLDQLFRLSQCPDVPDSDFHITWLSTKDHLQEHFNWVSELYYVERNHSDKRVPSYGSKCRVYKASATKSDRQSDANDAPDSTSGGRTSGYCSEGKGRMENRCVEGV
jgi:hypothetical protein